MVSTNCDGLHLGSGLTGDNCSELHGNCYKEICSKCKREYLRDFRVVKELRKDKKTFRFCEDPFCRGDLLFTPVAFNEGLPEKQFNQAFDASEIADVTIVMGTSMRVSPACELPTYNQKAKMVLINLQHTPYDKEAFIRSYSKTDDFMSLLMKELGLETFDQTYDYREILKKQNAPIKVELKSCELYSIPRLLSSVNLCEIENKNNSIIIIGGLGNEDEKFPSIEIYNGKELKSIPKDKDSKIPFLSKQRWGHSGSIIPSISKSDIYLIGGMDHQNTYNQVYIYNIDKNTIKMLETRGDDFSQRAGHSACVYKDKIIVYGGQASIKNGFKFLNDLYSFDPMKYEWKQLKTSGDVPEPRSQHSTVIHNNLMVVIGGYNSNAILNEFYVLNLDTLEWKNITPFIENIPKSIPIFDTKNMISANVSLLSTRKGILIYGFCNTSSLFIFDLDQMSLKEELKLDYNSIKSSISSLSQNTAVLMLQKDSKWNFNILKIQ